MKSAVTFEHVNIPTITQNHRVKLLKDILMFEMTNIFSFISWQISYLDVIIQKLVYLQFKIGYRCRGERPLT